MFKYKKDSAGNTIFERISEDELIASNEVEAFKLLMGYHELLMAKRWAVIWYDSIIDISKKDSMIDDTICKILDNLYNIAVVQENKIGAIKLVKELTCCSIKTAKVFVEVVIMKTKPYRFQG